MEVPHRVLVVSVFGRGAWMAAELQSQKMDVSFVDVTSQLGNWPIEDMVGPFPFLKSPKTSDSFSERVYTEDPLNPVPHGFTFWFPDGPVEMKGPVSSYLLDQKKLEMDFESLDRMSVSRRLKLIPLSHQSLYLIAKNFSTPYTNYELMNPIGEPLPLFSNIEIPSYNKTRFERVQHWLNEKGVRILTQSEILDFAQINSRKIKGVEFQGTEKKGHYGFDSIIWTLNSSESHFAYPKFANKIIKESPQDADWSWMRFRMQISGSLDRDALPHYFVLINDIEDSLFYNNFVIVIQTAASDSYDFWIRLPMVQRFNKSYLEKWALQIIQDMKSRIPHLGMNVQSYPQEYYYSFEELGPSRFPVYVQKTKNLKQKWENFYEDHNEYWTQYTLEARYPGQKKIVDDIYRRWQVETQKQEKKRKKNS